MSGESKLYSRYPVSTVLEIPEGNAMTEDLDQMGASNISPYHTFDSPYGCLRSAACIESRVKGLFISRDNINTLLQSVSNTETFAKDVLRTITYKATSNMKLTAHDLSTVHMIWTGDVSNSMIAGQFETFHTKLTFRSFFTKNWDLMRELSYLAVSDDAVKVLFAESNKTRSVTLDSVSPATNSLANQIRNLQMGCVEFNLHAAMVHSSLAFVMAPGKLTRSRRNCDECLNTNVFVVNTSKECGGMNQIHAVIDNIYTSHTICGKRLLQEPYIRNSSCEEQQSELDANANPRHIVFPNTMHIKEHSQGNREFVLLVEKLGDDRPNLCLYQIKGKEDVTLPQLMSLVYTTVERRSAMYQTYRNGFEGMLDKKKCTTHTGGIHTQATLPAQDDHVTFEPFCKWISHLFKRLRKGLRNNTMSVYRCYVEATKDFIDPQNKEKQPLLPTRDAVLGLLTLAAQKGFQMPIESTVIVSWIMNECLRCRPRNGSSKPSSRDLYIDYDKLLKWFSLVWNLNGVSLESAATRAEHKVQFLYPNVAFANEIAAKRAVSPHDEVLVILNERPIGRPALKRKRSTEQAGDPKR